MELLRFDVVAQVSKMDLVDRFNNLNSEQGLPDSNMSSKVEKLSSRLPILSAWRRSSVASSVVFVTSIATERAEESYFFRSELTEDNRLPIQSRQMQAVSQSMKAVAK